MQTSGPTRISYARHEDPSSALLAFAHNLLEGRVLLPTPVHRVSLRGGTKAGSAEPGAGLWRETFERLGELLARGALAYLIRAGGWRKERFIDGDEMRTGRIWESRECRELVLEVGEPCLSLVAVLFEILCEGEDDERNGQRLERVRLCVDDIHTRECLSEGLLLYALTRPVARLGSHRELVSALCEGGGLNQLTTASAADITAASARGDVPATLQRWNWALPWLAEHLATCWVRADGLKLSGGLERFGNASERLHRTLQEITAHATSSEGSLAALPLMAFFRVTTELQRSVEAQCEALEWMLETLPQGPRQHYRDLWGSILGLFGALHGQVQRIRATHPVERDAAARVVSAHWVEEEMEERFEASEALRTHLQRVIG